jgi:hypothetical protein
LYVCNDALDCYPTLDITEYVDDLTLGQAGPSWFNVDTLSSATDYVIDRLQNDLELEVSAAKSVVVASTRKQAESIARKTMSEKISYKADTKMLGTSTTAGARRSVKLLRPRLKSTRAKAQGIVKLRRSGVNTRTWARTAGLPGCYTGLTPLAFPTPCSTSNEQPLPRLSLPKGLERTRQRPYGCTAALVRKQSNVPGA